MMRLLYLHIEWVSSTEVTILHHCVFYSSHKQTELVLSLFLSLQTPQTAQLRLVR